MQVERPRAALNAQLLRLNEGYRSAGIARYIYHLLLELPRAVPEIALDVFATEPLAPERLKDVTVRATRLPVHKPLARIFWEQTFFPLSLRNSYALLHSLAYVSPFLNRTRSIVTLYDLSFYLYPQYFRPMQRLYLQIGTRASVRRAAQIITISESSKRDTVRLLQKNPEQIQVVPPGVEPEFFRAVNADEIEQFRRTKHLPEQFVLFLGTREPRKNLDTLIRAFVQAKRRANFPHYLVIAGGRGWLDQEIERTINELQVADQILFPGFVPHDELPLWFRAADLFVYPSQYEGFGMPALEALACGTPVITSNVSSLPEAVGDAARLVNPRATEELADAIFEMLTDDALRHEYARRGPEHARAFTWTRAAQQTADTYRRALGMRSARALEPATF